MRNLYLGVLLAPYRLDYYNYISENMNCDIYFQLRGFEGQLFSTEELEKNCAFGPKYLKITRLMGDRQVAWGLHKLIKNSNPEFIMVPEFSFLAMQVILIKKLFGYKYKIISQCDDSYAMLEGKGFSRFHAWSRKLCMPFIDNIVLLDNRSKDWYQTHYNKGIFMPLIVNEKMTSDEDEVKITNLATAQKGKYHLNNVKTILFVGRLVEVKNLFRLLDACSQLKIAYKLIVVGDGVLRSELEAYAKKLNVSTEFVGKKNGIELTAWYRCADVFVLPSTLEPFGAVTNEALVSGCNCCISKVAGSACIIKEGENGYLCDPYSVEDIARKIEKTSLLPVATDRKSKMTISFFDAMNNMKKEIDSKVLKVFHVITHLEVGGAERVAINIAKSKNERIEYHVIEVVRSNSDFAKELVDELQKTGVCVHRSPIKHNKMGLLLFGLWFSCVYLKFKPTIIHAHTEIPDLALCIFRKISWTFFWIHPKYIRTIHNTELWNGWKKIGKIVEDYYVKNQCNIAISQSTKEVYEKQYGAHNIPLIYNGIEEVPQKCFPSIVKGKINVLFAGRLEYQKGIEELITVVKAFGNSNRYHFHIIGSGSYSEKVNHEIGNFANVSLYDNVYGLSQYLGAFDFLFMPSNHEGLSLMSIEASFAHTPTIINRCPGLKDTLPDDWPLAVNDNNVEAFIDIFENKLNNIDYKSIAEQAYFFAKAHFSLEKMQKEYELKYLELV